MLDLGKIRDEIDSVDKQIVELFEARMELCKNVAEFKIANGKQVLDVQREKAKIEKIKEVVEDKANMQPAGELFKQIMAMSRKLQYQLLADHGIISDVSFESVDTIKSEDVKVVYQGAEGAYAHEAALNYFGEEVDCYNVESWKDAMEEVKSGKADYAVLPIENSTAGSITQVYDLLLEYDNYIVAETSVKVEHALVGMEGAKIEEITEVHSHPQALMQCEKYLEEHKNMHQYTCTNTALAAKKIAEEKDVKKAAIASIQAAKIYGLSVLKEKINTLDVNTTRFVIVGRKRIYTKEANKVSICVEISHEVGSLYNVLSHFIYNEINMIKIESRPIEDKKWEYRFIIDIEGKLGEAGIKNALRGISEEASSFAVLGNY